MAVNKNFVVRNGIEVSEDLIVASTSLDSVGLGTTTPTTRVDVAGGLVADNLLTRSYGISTSTGEFNVGTGGTIISAIPDETAIGLHTASPAYAVQIDKPTSDPTVVYVKEGDVVINNGNLNVGGASTFTGDVSFGSTATFGDNDRLKFGDNEDLEIFSTGTNSFIKETGSGNLKILGTNILIKNSGDNKTYADFNNGGSLELYYDNSKKFETTGAGVTIFGTTETQQLNVTGVATITTVDINAGDIEVTSVDTTDLNVTGVTTSTDKEIYNQFDITNNGSGYYEFATTGIGFTQATSNPTLYLQKGKNYRFSVNASGHPFYIKTVNSTGTGNAYEDGVTNNGAAVGIITFKVPYDAPDILYYNCQYHSSMNGEIRVGGAGAGVGIGSEGTFIGTGATMIDFKSSNGNNTVDLSAGIATVTVQTGVSIGLVIALGS